MLVFFTYRKVFNMESIEILVIIKRILINRFRETRNWKPLELNLIICKYYSIFRCNFIRINDEATLGSKNLLLFYQHSDFHRWSSYRHDDLILWKSTFPLELSMSTLRCKLDIIARSCIVVKIKLTQLWTFVQSNYRFSRFFVEMHIALREMFIKLHKLTIHSGQFQQGLFADA